MSEKLMTVAEMARMGGLARAKAHSKAELRAWGKQGGRPGKMDREALDRLKKLLASGMSQVDCAKALSVSVRTIGRAVAQMKAGTGPEAP
jgi:DNA invertase Pin-like site-specific DNA recombinase